MNPPDSLIGIQSVFRQDREAQHASLVKLSPDAEKRLLNLMTNSAKAETALTKWELAAARFEAILKRGAR